MITTTCIEHADRIANAKCDQPEVSEFEKFARDLAEYATQWIPRVQNNIAKHARELFDDATMRELIRKYAEFKRNADKDARYEFVGACLASDIDSVEENTFSNMKYKAYAEVLNDLIWAKYGN